MTERIHDFAAKLRQPAVAGAVDAYVHWQREALRARAEGITVAHCYEGRRDGSFPTVFHPLVRAHPVTGRKSLFVNEHFTRRIVELSHAESDMLLRHLTRWASNPRFTVRYHWSEGTIAMWDNRCTQHFVMDDFDAERIIQRVTVMGDEPEGAGPPRWPPYVQSGAPGAAGRHDRQLKAFLAGRADEG